MSTVEKLFCTVQGTNTLVLVGFAKKNKQTAVPYLPVVSPFECFMTVEHGVPFAFPHRDKSPHFIRSVDCIWEALFGEENIFKGL
jgi:hypothetical protein